MDLGNLTVENWLMNAMADDKARAARERLYDVFARYRLSPYGSPEGACPHCVSEDEWQAFDRTPVAELSAIQVTSYSLSVWPGISDFKYFLPRLLETWTELGCLEYCEEVERKFPSAGWETCSAEERHTIAEYIVASQQSRILARASEELEPARLLCPVAIRSRLANGLPLDECLDQQILRLRGSLFDAQLEAWMDGRAPTAISLLARTVSLLNEISGFASRRERRHLKFLPANDLVLDWILSGQARKVMDSAFEVATLSPDVYQKAAEALAVLANITPD